MNYLIIPDLRVQRANALSTSWFIGACPIFAVNMFAHALGKETGVIPTGVLVVHNNAQILAEVIPSKQGGRKILPHQYRSATYIDKSDYATGSEMSLSLQPTCSFHWSVSVVLAFDGWTPSLADVEEFLSQRHLAGGLIVKHGKVQIANTLEQVKKMIGSGRVLKDASSRLGTEQRVRTMLELVGHRQSKSEENPWVTPAVMGYALLTTPSTKTGVRSGVEHSYAEPLVGLVEYASVNSQTPEQLAQAFWEHKWVKNDVFVVSNFNIQ